MFNLGFSEMLAIGALALIIIGPKQLPEVAKVLARTLNEFKRATGDLGKTFADVKNDTMNSINEAKNEIQKQIALEDMEKEIENLSEEIKSHREMYGEDHSDLPEGENVTPDIHDEEEYQQVVSEVQKKGDSDV